MKHGINYSKDTRPHSETLVQYSRLQELADQHLNFMLTRDSNSLLPVFAANASVCYRQLKTEGKKAKETAIKIARAERLQKLVDMFTKSNTIDFIMIKFPAWWLNDKIERNNERRMQNV